MGACHFSERHSTTQARPKPGLLLFATEN